MIITVSRISALLLILGTAALLASAEEISLFDSKGRATAYITEDGTIYLWDGKPVAYLDGERHEVLSVYSFDGKHLGWFKAGILYDDEGDATGAVKEAFTTPTELEPLKGLKELKPLKGLKELKPLKPLFSMTWADLPLKYLLAGKEDFGTADAQPLLVTPPDSKPSRHGSGCDPPIETHIDGDFNGWDDEVIYKMDNAQIWQQLNYHYHYHYAYHPSVIIYSNRFGLCHIKVEGDDDEGAEVTRLK